MTRGDLADGISAVASLPVAAAGAYLGLLSLSSTTRRGGVGDRSVRFAVVVPAHDEAAHIERTVLSLLATDYPVERRRVVVVADNCSDDTAARARGAGAEVIERADDEHRGKGYALTYAFERLLAETWVDAVAVVDADTVVSANFLSACAARFATGEHAVQAEYRVANADESWRTRLMAIAFTCFHDVRSSGRERFRLSSGLRGNGMAFSRSALERVPHRAASLTEDLEHGIALGEARIRVAYAAEACVEADMPAQASQAASQRDRWERGRAALRRKHAWPLLRDGVRRRDRVRVDLALDLLVPPLAVVAEATAASLVAAGALRVLRGRAGWTTLPALVAAGGLGGHVAVGWKRSGTGRAGLSAVLRVPAYVVWKTKLALTRRRGAATEDATEWVRTARSPLTTAPDHGGPKGGECVFSPPPDVPMQPAAPAGTAFSRGPR